jgi:transcriptional regulator with XRE-family HTH domain
MASRHQAAVARRQADRIHRGLSVDLRRLREDAGATRSQVANAAGVDLAHLCRIEDGRERPSIDTDARLSAALGSDLNARIYPGPAIHDRHQARIVEALLQRLHSRWHAYLEVPVRSPARGFTRRAIADRAAGSHSSRRRVMERRATVPGCRP